MGDVVSLEDFRAKHHPGYIRGCILDNWLMWSNGQTPSNSGWGKSQTPTRYGWNKEEADKKVAENRKHTNESVKKSYRIKGKSDG